MPENKQVTFPYKTLDIAVKDKFKKIGGPEKAFAFLVKGFKSVEWRRRADKAARARDEAEDVAVTASAKKA
jgi:hypothetical protein